ncbi:hypothetical protein COY52_04885 [Candidatus Desantisbacteria bacterium CG_4_10_14_0_8_um_filter_48_22]|uniref:HTH cro/C1-type domain-containing protein n=1 Tax=Candidatus Desantisbacteria bacterium CG_4_10_14_0_8_um_filter_48_22 TaxID=1974543 RepID=A0A2M7SDB1_9BACT|nr:MAG: hypothetical protein AUJ67_07120 [Candidatus Desantisbacteria bacterium CG1_02_49_89]PIV54393.1 MAG: hypothetical protein COS16_10610 [Candidatus Desantisbacteria bacterium CG02_land_8_20_14_3_00_49_13]PIZ17273.1 MAG: hypothetical protein COY52_04885 [Candidatus Desantisbacteria bacterium CG_4_10_14_0_8_um_filter_48_22]
MISMVSKLKEARENKNISFEKASEDTRISLKFLKALEEEKYEIFPAEVYLKGFMRIYSEYLGLNSNEIIEDYKKSK